MAAKKPNRAISKKNNEKEAESIDSAMLSLLVCPLTKQSMQLNRDKSELKSVAARLAYPIRGGVPILLPSEARSLTDREL